MASLFEAYITNLGKYNEGELVGETLKFPTTTEDVQALLKRIGVDGVRYEEFFITSFDGDVLGLYPYVWGGSSPATSFDCSGFVSWVINHSGWNVGRLGAQGLYNICTPTSNPKPGDLVFFVGTYDTAGVSHCGIYVGDGMMIHCGDPIQYANLNTSYWQSHFYAYGRLP